MVLPPPAGATAIVVPGYFACAGVLAFAAVMSTLGAVVRRSRLHLCFALVCACSTGACLAIARYYSAPSLAAAEAPMRDFAFWAVLLLYSVFAFVAAYTRVPRQRPGFVVLLALAAITLYENAHTPFGIWLTAVERSSAIVLPWGERLFHAQALPSLWNVGLRLLALAIVGWGVWRLLGRKGAGDRRAGLLLSAYLVVLFAASVQGALIDFGVVRTFHWIGLALVGFAMLMGADLILILREQDVAMREQAFRDPLTGLANRGALLERLCLHCDAARAGFGAVAHVNLDHFKVLNEALSHEVGDRVLREVASRIACACGEAAIPGRIGGDEFAALLAAPAATRQEAEQAIRRLADDILRALAAPFVLGEQDLHVAASAGIASFECARAQPAESFAHAALALREAKKSGRHQVRAFAPGLQSDAETRFRTVEGLRRAIASDALQLHYQPQVDAAGRVAGMEALVRWLDGPHGLVSPATFIPLAEETGLIHALGEWTLRRGCAQLAAWRREGIDTGGTLSINVSPWQLARPGFVERLAHILRESGVDPPALTIEITESAALYDLQETIARLHAIRASGVRIALDDFGTGYSSLSLVRDLPLDAIKIDQSFVRGIDAGANRHLVKAVVEIAAELRLDVVAEGIENERERSALLELGCPKLQGFLVCRPLPAPELTAWLAAHELKIPVA
ncbi:MAG TPA: bifunctional diguanylate cyclase/phosphodiesterase [Usitatibacter sp.]|nr:bifunctional diguanylate cyclase/phosphodiesterase [Usitatibacter sp.]